MKKSLAIFAFFISLIIQAQSSTIYSKSYGNRANPAIIYIHGGPRGNATLFEGTTAQTLADRGFFVIVYDRRGEGRSVDTNATFTFQEAIKDLNGLYQKYHLKKVNILAHSFGGLVGTLFTEQNPDKVESLILVGALVSQQETYDHILKSSKKIADEKKDSLILIKIAETETLDKNSAEYRKKTYEVASHNDYFKMPNPTAESNQLRANYESSEFGKNNIRNDNAPILFYKNESRNNIDTKSTLKKIKAQNVKLFAIYGKQDGIFSAKQLNDVRNIVSDSNLKLIDNCSHYPFVDQQENFINAIEKWLK